VELLVVRHAQSTWNAEHRWAGQRDPGLTAKGRRDAAELGGRLAATRPPFASVACSNLQRARQTAEILAQGLGLPPPMAVPGLRERDGGAWTALTSPEIEARFPGELDRWRRGEVVDPPASEPMEAFTARVASALGELAASARGERALVVAHQGVLRALEHHFGIAPLPAAELHGVWLRARGAPPAWLRHW
jgi:glucosyl-3-phosphoglycerate phosphatase